MLDLHLGGEINLASCCRGEAVRMYLKEPQRVVMSRKLRKSSINSCLLCQCLKASTGQCYLEGRETERLSPF